MNRQLTATVMVAVLFGSLIIPVAEATDQFGRLFTTPSQRERLEELRKVAPEQKITIQEETLLVDEETVEEEVIPVDTLTVRGVVYRGDGKSTAWINNSNTFEGGLSSQYINIGEIESNRVEIKIPSAEQEVKLNVGQSFDPVGERYQDIISDPTARISNAE